MKRVRSTFPATTLRTLALATCFILPSGPTWAQDDAGDMLDNLQRGERVEITLSMPTSMPRPPNSPEVLSSSSS